MVLSAPADLGAAPVRSVAARAQNVAVPARTVVARAQNVEVVDRTAAGDHDAVGVQNAEAFPHAARVLSATVGARNFAEVDRDVGRGSRFAQGVQVGQIARCDPFRPAAGSFPGALAVHFVPAALFSRAAPVVPQGLQFPLRVVWWEQLKVVALAVPNR